MRISDGAVVPGNRHLDAAERDRRVRHYYEPYHLRIDGLIERCVAAGVPPVLLSIHSFTESWKGVPRPWHAAILWDRDYRFSVPLLEALRAEGGIIVGENEPYDGKLAGDCMWQHGTRRGLAHTIIEVRQDLIRTPEGQRAWAERIAAAVQAVFARTDIREAMHRVQYFGSHTDTEGHAAVHEPRGKEPRMTDIDRETATRARSRRLPPARRASARAHRRAEHRPDEPRRLLPQLPVQLVSGGGGRARASISARTRRARSSTACPTRNGSSATRPKPRPKRRPLSPNPSSGVISHRPVLAPTVTRAPQVPQQDSSGWFCGLALKRQGGADSVSSHHYDGRRAMTTLQVSAQKQLRQLVEQIERLEEEKKALAGDIRDKFLEAKGLGFDVKVLRQVVRLRKKSATERQEEDAVLEVYLHALGMLEQLNGASHDAAVEAMIAAE